MSDGKPLVAILMGSKSDLPNLKGVFTTLEKFGVPFVARVLSAHRTPDETVEFTRKSEAEGVKTFICAAGMAAHLGGVVAANCVVPVIGIPMPCEPFNGWDAMLSTLMMPPGIPVATVTAGKAGGTNAALLAVSIIALSDPALREKLLNFRKEQGEKVKRADATLNEDITQILAGK